MGVVHWLKTMSTTGVIGQDCTELPPADADLVVLGWLIRASLGSRFPKGTYYIEGHRACPDRTGPDRTGRGGAVPSGWALSRKGAPIAPVRRPVLLGGREVDVQRDAE